MFYHSRLARWAGKWMDPTGKTVWVYAPTERECWAKLDRQRTERLLELERGPVAAAQGSQRAPEAVPWLLAWAEGQEGGHPTRWRPATKKRAMELLARLKQSGAWEGKSLAEVHMRDVQALINQAGSDRWVCPWSWRTVRNFHSCLRGGFGDALKQGVVTANPAVGVMLPVPVASPRISLEDEERKAVIEEALRRQDGQLVHRLGDLIAFLALTGLRSGEARALTYDDVDLREKDVRVTKTVSIGEEERLAIGPPKRKSSERTLALPTLAVEVVKARAKEAGLSETALGKFRSDSQGTRKIKGKFYVRFPYGLAEEKKEAWIQAPSSQELIWMTANGTPFDHQAVRKALHEVIRTRRHYALDRFRCKDGRVIKKVKPSNWKEAPVCPLCDTNHWAPFHPHVLRAAAISFWIRHEATVVAVAQRAGHSDPRMVLQYYASSSRKEDREMAQKDD